jgi:hypothetical protein
MLWKGFCKSEAKAESPSCIIIVLQLQLHAVLECSTSSRLIGDFYIATSSMNGMRVSEYLTGCVVRLISVPCRARTITRDWRSSARLSNAAKNIAH